MAHFQFTSLLLRYQEGENVCQSQVSAEAQFNVTKAEVKQIINDAVNPQLNTCDSILRTRSRHERFRISLPY